MRAAPIARFVLGFALLCGGPAMAQQGGLTRSELQKQSFPKGYVTETFLVSVAPGALVARHTHPGVEMGYLLSGHGTLSVAGQPDRAVKAGDSWSVPDGVVHALQNGDEATRIVVTYVVEQGKPLATPAAH